MILNYQRIWRLLLFLTILNHLIDVYNFIRKTNSMCQFDMKWININNYRCFLPWGQITTYTYICILSITFAFIWKYSWNRILFFSKLKTSKLYSIIFKTENSGFISNDISYFSAFSSRSTWSFSNPSIVLFIY